MACPWVSVDKRGLSRIKGLNEGAGLAWFRLWQAGFRVNGLGIPQYLDGYFVYSAKILSLITFISRGLSSQLMILAMACC